MIYRGIIEEIISPYKLKIRIPIIHRLKNSAQFTSSEDLPDASICTIPYTYYHPRVGDIVIVGFENNDLGKPIILGYLFKEFADDSHLSMTLSSLSVSNTTQLSEDTTIGNITPAMLKQLAGIRNNIQKQLDDIEERLRLLEKVN